jgi:hypothetical protein
MIIPDGWRKPGIALGAWRSGFRTTRNVGTSCAQTSL